MHVYVMVPKGRKHRERKRAVNRVKCCREVKKLGRLKASIGFRNMRWSLQELCWWYCQDRSGGGGSSGSEEMEAVGVGS